MSKSALNKTETSKFLSLWIPFGGLSLASSSNLKWLLYMRAFIMKAWPFSLYFLSRQTVSFEVLNILPVHLPLRLNSMNKLSDRQNAFCLLYTVSQRVVEKANALLMEQSYPRNISTSVMLFTENLTSIYQFRQQCQLVKLFN